MKERREWQRVPVDIVAKCRLTEEPTYHHVCIIDMHHQGCRLKSRVEFKAGQEVRIIMDRPALGNLYFVGSVAWVNYIGGQEAYQIGVRFIINDPVTIENSSKLYTYLSSR